VSDVRQSFFNFLQPYLDCVPDFIIPSFKGNDVDCIFGNYFLSKEYEKHVGEKEDKGFA